MLETVMRTMFYCAGSYAWHAAAVALVVTAWNKMLGFTLARSKLQEEDWPEFIHRIHSKLQELTQLFEMPAVESLLAGLHAGWTGHVVRSSMYSCVYVVGRDEASHGQAQVRASGSPGGTMHRQFLCDVGTVLAVAISG